ncbi:TetR/AcrR family transcriptional regulator [bacterium]|nr:TetR/AcrR family transcriptional regulator [bacterium]
MAKIKQSPKLPPEKRRRQLLDAATRLFVRKGYRGTTTEQIARAAKLTKGALYHHFKSKEDILLGILADMMARFDLAVTPLAGTKFAPQEFVRVLFEAQAKDNYAEFRTLVDLWVQALRIPRIRKFFISHYRMAQDFFSEHVDRAYGRNRADREQLAIHTFAFVDGLATRLALDPKSADVETQIRLFARTVESEKRRTKKK